MKKIFLLTFFAALFAFNVQGQVTIGSEEPPHSKALLDLKEGTGDNKDESAKGLFLPRVNLASAVDFFGTNEHQDGAVVYNRNTSATSVAVADRVSPGFYYNNGVRWEKLALGYTNWFYMPSIAIPTGSTTPEGVTEEIDLYTEYKKQFDGSQADTYKASAGAPAVIPYIPEATDLYYYITYYSPDVFDVIEITEEGKMKYKVIGSATDCSYVNVVFVLK